MTRNERLLRDAKTSAKEAYELLSRIEHLDRDCIQRLNTVASQSAQTSREVNQLVGSLTDKFFGD